MLFAFYVFISYWLTFQIGLYGLESMSRTVDVWNTYKDGVWRSSAVGFLLPPLLTLLTLPLAFIPLLREAGFAGNIVTCAFGAIAYFAFCRILPRLGVPRSVRLALMIAFALNPLLWLYSANGASEILFVALVLLTILQALALIGRSRGLRGAPLDGSSADAALTRMIAIGFLAGFTVLARYAGAVFVPLWLTVIILFGAVGREGRRPIDALTTLYLFPVSFMVGLWLLISLLIVGDAFYALNHIPEAAMRQGVDDAVLQRMFGQIRAATPQDLVTALATQLGSTQLIFSAGLVALAVGVLRRDRQALVLLGAGLALLATNVFQLPYRREPFELRDLLLAVPLGLLGLGWIASRWRQPVILAATICLAIISPLIGSLAMVQARDGGEWPREFLMALITQQPTTIYASEQEIGRALAATGGGDVLIDDLVGYRLIFLSGAPDRFVTRMDKIFPRALRDSGAYVSYVVVSGGPISGFDLIGQTYPGLYTFGAEWARQVASWQDWRLYAVSRPSRAE